MEYISVMCLSYPDPQVHYESGQAPKYGKSEEAKRESRTEAAEEDSHWKTVWENYPWGKSLNFLASLRYFFLISY